MKPHRGREGATRPLLPRPFGLAVEPQSGANVGL